MRRVLIGLLLATAIAPVDAQTVPTAGRSLAWQRLPDLPDAIGVAGPMVGVHGDALIVAGGANFPVAEGGDLWDAAKVWHDDARVLSRTADGALRWRTGYRLSRPVAYGACVSTPWGVACLGGNDGQRALADCFLLKWDPQKGTLRQTALPRLPEPCAYGAAAMVDGVVYLAGGQRGAGLETAMANFWRLDLRKREEGAADLAWEELPAWHGPSRAFNITVAQHNGSQRCIYVISGRRQANDSEAVGAVTCLRDVHEFNPRRYDPGAALDPKSGRYTGSGRFASPWRRRADVPRCVMAGTAAAVGPSRVFVLSGADGSLIGRESELRDRHPGFPKRALAYDTIANTWTDAGPIPANQVTTPAARWGNVIVVASGEVRPRVRTRAVWAVK